MNSSLYFSLDSMARAQSRTRQYVEHPEARKRRWVWCIGGRSWKLVRNAG
jgi:hypothetical protein